MSDTLIGGSRRDFTGTFWSDVLQTQDRDAEVRRRAWERLAERYWKPVYCYIRARWGGTNEDIKDTTQDFFAWMMETQLPGRADPRRGRFRVFLCSSLTNFLRNRRRNRLRKKRGGDRLVLVFEGDADRGGPREPPDRASGSAEEALDQMWKEELLARAAKVLKETFSHEDKEIYFKLFQDYYLSPAPGVKHDDLAARYALRISDVNNYLMAAKRRFREILGDLVAETVDGPSELREEMKALFGREKP